MYFISPVARTVSALRPWPAALLAVVLGGGSVFAFAPFHFPAVLLVTLPALVWLLDGAASTRRILAVSWLFAAALHTAGMHWLANAFLVEPSRHAAFLPLPLLFTILVLPAFHAAACLIARRLLWSGATTRILALAACLALADWVRGHAFTGFPWNLWGNSLTAHLPLAQPAALVGVYGLSLMALLVALVPAMRLRPALLIVVLAGGAWEWGSQRMETPIAETETEVRLVQPSFPQQQKQNRANLPAMADSLLRLTFATPPPRIIVWPEVALRAHLADQHELRARLAALMPRDAKLLTGSLRRDAAGRYNSLLVINARGQIEAAYDKRHLVPFGEYIPYSDRLRDLGLGIRALASSGFAAGSAPRVLDLGDLPAAAALICYEAIFSGDIVPDGEPRPEWLVNISNDAWFGDSIGPRQHLDQARLRAIEEGLPMLRATNTGISALIDPLGRITHRLETNRLGILDVQLPAPLPPTFFSRWGDMPALLASAVLLLLSAVAGLTARWRWRARHPAGWRG